MRYWAFLALAIAGSATAAPDAQNGRKLYAQCQSCHSLDNARASKLGPNLNGIVGQRAASRPGYRYSPALATSGLVWDAKTLDRWLARPSATVPGSKMSYVVNNPAHRADIIAFLAGTKR